MFEYEVGKKHSLKWENNAYTKILDIKKKLFRLSEEKSVVELNNLFPRSTEYHQHAKLDLETSEET